MRKKTKIIITSITLAGLLFAYYNYDYKYVPQYVILDNDANDYFIAKYQYGDVYIVKTLSAIEYVNENDIIVLDQREDDNPSMQIISSHKISDKNIRNDIIEIIMEYEKRNPSAWNRTPESMRLEWFVHNFFYNLNYKRNHTDNVDLDNNDEEQYNNVILNKVLKI